MDASHLDPAKVDYAALEVPLTRAEIRDFHARIRSAQRTDPSISTGLTTATSVISIIAIVGFVGIFFLIFGVTIVGGLITSSVAGSVDGGSIGIELSFLLLFAVIAFVVFRSLFGSGGNWAKWLRLTRFASANGLQFRTRSANPEYPGCVFNLGDTRQATDHFSTVEGRYLDFGNYQYSTGSGKNRTTRHWGFLAMQLDRNLPNIVLDSKANNSLFGSTNLPATFSRDQVLSLEGDFDRYFTLYCPKEYEQDALYVFTPDLMALLIDDAAPFDVEIIDSWLLVYSASPFDMLSTSTYQRLFRIVQTVGSKAVSQTARYHDDRVASAAANIVAPQGQRLRHGVSVSTLVIGAIFAAFWLWSTFHGS
ncbi:MAG: hypothetical protein JWR36_931 [Glaciihabitans sp.]|nr:hypothetical protein [Glaciihabitans sp.]